LLIAGMGDNYIRKHRWQDERWFTEVVQKKLDKFREAGVPIRGYSPDTLQATHEVTQVN